MKNHSPLMALLGTSLCFAFAPLAVADLSEPSLWKVNLGEEMPGAVASPENGTDDGFDYVGLDFDFSNGGAYVALTNSTAVTDKVKELRFQIQIDSPRNVGVRIVDAQGEVFQYLIADVPPGEWSDQRIKFSDVPETRFMVTEQTGNEKIDYPISGVWLIVQNNPNEAAQGKAKFRKIEVK